MTVRAIGLVSGGLDSMLAVAVLREQGIDVTGISFTTPFFSSKAAETASRQLGFPLLIRDITDPHMEVVKNPLSGYGANMNPCIDCHALMVREAGRIMEQKAIKRLGNICVQAGKRMRCFQKQCGQGIGDVEGSLAQIEGEPFEDVLHPFVEHLQEGADSFYGRFK